LKPPFIFSGAYLRPALLRAAESCDGELSLVQPIAHGERLSFARVFFFSLLILLSQGHPDSVVPFDFGEGAVDVIGWAQMQCWLL
jgi:hypothetical protein